MTLGQVIKLGRDSQNLSRRRFADMMHIEEKTLKKYEEDAVANPDKRLVNEIFYALDMQPPFDDDGNIVFPIRKNDGTEITDENGTDKNGTEKPVRMKVSDETTRYGTCAYCGQQALIVCNRSDDQDYVDAQATWECRCTTATEVRRKAEAAEEERQDRQRRIDAAVLDINNLIADAGYPDVSAILCIAVPPLIDGKMKKISITIDSKNSVTVSIAAKKIKVERKQVKKDQAESE